VSIVVLSEFAVPMISQSSSRRIVIISGPSGAGKSTVVRQLLAECTVPLRHSVSATTRQPRPGEVNGQHYHFLTHAAFTEKRAAGEFLECKEVFGRGDWYGTLESEVANGLAAGNWMVLEIDVEGAMSVLQHYPEAITIFVHVGDIAELERRLRERGTESEEALRRRIEVASKELAAMHRYRHEVVNHDVDQAVAAICEILKTYQSQEKVSH
jgi:guanylate kinase